MRPADEPYGRIGVRLQMFASGDKCFGPVFTSRFDTEHAQKVIGYTGCCRDIDTYIEVAEGGRGEQSFEAVVDNNRTGHNDEYSFH